MINIIKPNKEKKLVKVDLTRVKFLKKLTILQLMTIIAVSSLTVTALLRYFM